MVCWDLGALVLLSLSVCLVWKRYANIKQQLINQFGSTSQPQTNKGTKPVTSIKQTECSKYRSKIPGNISKELIFRIGQKMKIPEALLSIKGSDFYPVSQLMGIRCKILLHLPLGPCASFLCITVVDKFLKNKCCTKRVITNQSLLFFLLVFKQFPNILPRENLIVIDALHSIASIWNIWKKNDWKLFNPGKTTQCRQSSKGC